jgi:hypothetical protein
VAGEVAVAEPFCYAQGEQQASEGDAREGDDEGEPAGVGAGAGGREAAEHCNQQQAGHEARTEDRCAPLEQLAGAVGGNSD